MAKPAKPVPSPAEMRKMLSDARAGDTLQLGRLLALVRPYLLAVARRDLSPKLRGKVAPSDVVQQTLVDAQRDLAQFSGSRWSALGGWLRKVLLNNIADAHQRFLGTGKRDVDKEQPLDDAASHKELAEMARRRDQTPSKHFIRQEGRERIQRALDSLTPSHRDVIRLRDFEHLSYAEIAIEMERSEESARMLHLRALAALAKRYENDDE